jgi:hypothetical protein
MSFHLHGHDYELFIAIAPPAVQHPNDFMTGIQRKQGMLTEGSNLEYAHSTSNRGFRGPHVALDRLIKLSTVFNFSPSDWNRIEQSIPLSSEFCSVDIVYC